MSETIYMPLKNEGTDVWVAVQAEPLEDGLYRIAGHMPDDQEWKFPPGCVVTVQLKQFADGKSGTAAVAQYWTYRDWLKNTIEKIVRVGMSVPEKDRADWFRLQIELAIQQSLRHGRSGRTDDDPVVP